MITLIWGSFSGFLRVTHLLFDGFRNLCPGRRLQNASLRNDRKLVARGRFRRGVGDSKIEVRGWTRFEIPRFEVGDGGLTVVDSMIVLALVRQDDGSDTGSGSRLDGRVASRSHQSHHITRPLTSEHNNERFATPWC